MRTYASDTNWLAGGSDVVFALARAGVLVRRLVGVAPV